MSRPSWRETRKTGSPDWFYFPALFRLSSTNMRFPELHSWDLTPRQAVGLQKDLAHKVVLTDTLCEPVQLVAGVDVSYRRRADQFHGAVVVMDLESASIVETATASGQVSFPYVPGLLSFRELPVLLEAFKRLRRVPQVVLVDGQGIAHPRRLGVASHLGLWLDLPTIGCAKSRLCGEAGEPGPSRGQHSQLLLDGTPVGAVLRTRDHVRPLFISPGHRMDIRRSIQIVLRCGQGYRLPEPTRQAHLASNLQRIRQEGGIAQGFSADPYR